MYKYKLNVEQALQLAVTLLMKGDEADICGLVEMLGQDGELDVEWNPSAQGRARLVISGSDADMEDLCALICTLRPWALPVSSFVQLKIKSELLSGNQVNKEKTSSVSVGALFGIAVGELITRLNGSLSSEWISYGRLSRTFAYCYAQLNFRSDGLLLEDVWRRWRDARRILGNEDSVELESEIFGCIGLIDHATRLVSSQSESRLIDVLGADNPTDGIIQQVKQRLPNIQPYLIEFDGALENRLRGFDKCVQIIQKLDAPVIEKSIFVAALANRILPGSGAYFHVLSPLAQNFPGVFVWYGYLSAHEGGGDFAKNFAPVFRKFIDAVETSISDAILKVNVDYCELHVMHRAREVAALRRVADGSFVVIDLGNGVLAQVPFAARMEGKGGLDSVDLVPRSHVEKLLGEAEKILKLGAQLGYLESRDSGPKSKSRTSKSTKGKAKISKEAGSLF
ncbi:MAG: hypothetical protein K2P67_00175 [Gallionellaceae bacterium]|nr:hypothetical protein [Gallionellaceae bacterium]